MLNVNTAVVTAEFLSGPLFAVDRSENGERFIGRKSDPIPRDDFPRTGEPGIDLKVIDRSVAVISAIGAAGDNALKELFLPGAPVLHTDAAVPVFSEPLLAHSEPFLPNW
jgi:hypothetical protein